MRIVHYCIVLWLTCALNHLVLSRRGDNLAAIDQNGNYREPKLFSLFNVVTFANTVCSSTSVVTAGGRRNGTCLTAAQCAAGSGAASGNCAAGFGVCCVFIVSATGSSINRNCTYIQNPGFPTTSTATAATTYTIQKQVANVCQVRLDFLTFTLQGPADTNELMGGQCAMDTFTITEPTNQGVPVICGENSGQHMYIDMGAAAADTVTLSFAFAGNFMRAWDIKATQLPCGAEYLAPNGCLQYHTSVSGRFTTFNFAPMASNHLANQDYPVCIRQARGFCCIQYLPCPDANSFSLDTNGATVAKPLIAMQDNSCTQDYIGIEASSSNCGGGKAVSTASRYCGTLLNSIAVAAVAAGMAASIPICDCNSPFRVDIVTDALSDAGDMTTNNMLQSRGVCLTYMQLPC